MTVKLGVNGFGRIGRLVCRAALEHGGDVMPVAVNDVSGYNRSGRYGPFVHFSTRHHSSRSPSSRWTTPRTFSSTIQSTESTPEPSRPMRPPTRSSSTTERPRSLSSSSPRRTPRTSRGRQSVPPTSASRPVSSPRPTRRRPTWEEAPRRLSSPPLRPMRPCTSSV